MLCRGGENRTPDAAPPARRVTTILLPDISYNFNMKLISLNTWGGKQFKPLIKFIKQNSEDTDVFSFQEVFKTNSSKINSFGYRINLYAEISKVLKDYNVYFVSTIDNYISGSFQPNFINFDLSWGQAIFVNKKITVDSSGHFFVFGRKETFNPKDWNSFPRAILYVTIKVKNNLLTICNLHGIWTKEGKGDTPSRISQSDQINDFLDKRPGEKIFCGDLNLDMNTQSIKLLEKNMTNLIKEYKISTTRSSFFPGHEKFADYTFVSPDILVKDFKVPNVKISDHLPMILQFS